MTQRVPFQSFKPNWSTALLLLEYLPSRSSSNDIPRSAMLQRALSRDPKIRLLPLVAPSGEHAQSEGETSVVIDREVAPTAVRHAKRLDWRVAARIVTCGRVVWAIDSFAPSSTGMDGIFPALLQVGQKVLITYLVKIFHACLTTGYVPAIWRQVNLVFIPKPSKNSYGRPKDFRPISLTSFLLKTM